MAKRYEEPESIPDFIAAHNERQQQERVTDRKNARIQLAIAFLGVPALIWAIGHYTDIDREHTRTVAGVDAEVLDTHHGGAGAHGSWPSMTVRQCGTDIAAALHGKLHQESFATPGGPDASCFVENVLVSDADSYKYTKGQVVVFDGKLGQSVLDQKLDDQFFNGTQPAHIAAVVPPQAPRK